MTRLTNWTLGIVIALLIGAYAGFNDEFEDRQIQSDVITEAVASAKIAAVEQKTEAKNSKHDIHTQMAKWDYLGVGK